MGVCHWRRQVFQYHPVLGWWHLPNLLARIPLGQTYHLVKTNSIGMRSEREYPTSRPEGRKRVLFLGDSYTAGDGVDNRDRFTDLLEQRYPHLDALNFGLNGSGTDQQLLIFETMAAEYEADAYVFCICVENIARNLYDCFPSYFWREQLVAFRPKPYFKLTETGLELCNTPVPKARRTADELGDWQYAFPYIPGESDPYAIYKNGKSNHWLTMKAILQRLLAHTKGCPVFIVPMPMYNHYLNELEPLYLPRFQELADPVNEIYVVDLLPAMKAAPMDIRRKFRFPDDPHYTALAHATVANVLEREFADRTPVLLKGSHAK